MTSVESRKNEGACSYVGWNNQSLGLINDSINGFILLGYQQDRGNIPTIDLRNSVFLFHWIVFKIAGYDKEQN